MDGILKFSEPVCTFIPVPMARSRAARPHRTGKEHMSDTTQHSKIKIGTILDASTVEKLKERSFRQKKTISAVLEEAVAQLGSRDAPDIEVRRRTLERLFGASFSLTKRELNIILEDDSFDQ